MLPMKTAYEKPSSFSRPYDNFDDSVADEILKTPDDGLSDVQLCCLFTGGTPIGIYDETVYYIPIALQYISDRRPGSVSVLEALLFWSILNYPELQSDDIWTQMDDCIDTMFRTFTEKFTVNHGDMPLEAEYIDVIIKGFNHTAFIDKLLLDHAFPERIADKYMERRFENPQTYDDYAWLVVLTNGYKRVHYGINGARLSHYLRKWANTTAWHQQALLRIIERTEQAPELSGFWSECLDHGMIF